MWPKSILDFQHSGETYFHQIEIKLMNETPRKKPSFTSHMPNLLWEITCQETITSPKKMHFNATKPISISSYTCMLGFPLVIKTLPMKGTMTPGPDNVQCSTPEGNDAK